MLKLRSFVNTCDKRNQLVIFQMILFLLPYAYHPKYFIWYSCLPCTIIYLQVILSHGQQPLTCPLPPGVQQAPPVTSVLDDGTLEFKNGERTKPEVFLFCTGYNFTFPFLDKKVGVKVQEHLVWPLYKFLIPPAYPSLFIVGICRAICPFPHFHIQVSCKAKDILFKGIRIN